MAKAKGTTKQVKTTVNRLKASQKPQAHRPRTHLSNHRPATLRIDTTSRFQMSTGCKERLHKDLLTIFSDLVTVGIKKEGKISKCEGAVVPYMQVSDILLT
jgi:hypothetical protein